MPGLHAFPSHNAIALPMTIQNDLLQFPSNAGASGSQELESEQVSLQVSAPFSLGSAFRSHPLGAFSPKAGFLYLRVVEASNLTGFFGDDGCFSQSSSSSAGGCLDSLGGLFGFSSCSSRPSKADELVVSFCCVSLERTMKTKEPCVLNVKDGRAVFGEEFLLQLLNFCSADRLQISLETKAGIVLAEGSLPLRAAVPQATRTSCEKALGSDKMAADIKEAWPPRSKVFLQAPLSRTGNSSNIDAEGQAYVELELLQVTDGCLPSHLASELFALALRRQQEQLVRGYLCFDYADRLTTEEQAACLSAAIECRSLGLLMQLLDHMRPNHEHLLLAIKLGAEECIEPLLQAGGPSLLHPRASARSYGSSTSSSVRNNSSNVRRNRSSRGGVLQHQVWNRGMQTGLVGMSRSSPRDDVGGEDELSSSDKKRKRQLTPLSLACSLGEVKIVEALCQWAQKQKVHLDPSAPFPEGSYNRRGHDGVVHNPALAGHAHQASSSTSSSPWWEQEEIHGENESQTKFGDPPMVMAVRGRASLSAKLQMLTILSQHGFTADVRSPVDGWTPLLAAVEHGCLQLCSALIKLGGRVCPDRTLGFTPLHLACQIGHWHIISLLVDTMRSQHSRLAEWGPSPQYVSLNLPDAYGRTALDIALLHYFSNPILGPVESLNTGAPLGIDSQKAVDVLREFIHRRPTDDPDMVCGLELFQVLNLLYAIPSRKVFTEHVNTLIECDRVDAQLVSVDEKISPKPATNPSKELFEALRVLVKAGAQTRWLLQDLVNSPGHTAKGLANSSLANLIESVSWMGPRPERYSTFSPLDPEDIAYLSEEESL